MDCRKFIQFIAHWNIFVFHLLKYFFVFRLVHSARIRIPQTSILELRIIIYTYFMEPANYNDITMRVNDGTQWISQTISIKLFYAYRIVLFIRREKKKFTFRKESPKILYMRQKSSTNKRKEFHKNIHEASWFHVFVP